MRNSVARAHSVQIRKQRIGQLGGMRAVARDVQRHAVQLLTVAADEVFPRAFVAGGTGARQRQFFQTQRCAEISLLFRRSRRQILALNFFEDRRELFRAHAVGRGAAARIEFCGNGCISWIGRAMACPSMMLAIF